jgi:hypothetical protein
MSWTNTRARIASTLRADPSADVTELRRQLKAERLADYVARAVQEAPPLTAEQRGAIAGLLNPSSASGQAF